MAVCNVHSVMEFFVGPKLNPIEVVVKSRLVESKKSRQAPPYALMLKAKRSGYRKAYRDDERVWEVKEKRRGRLGTGNKLATSFSDVKQLIR